jgi:hypothetical protein
MRTCRKEIETQYDAHFLSWKGWRGSVALICRSYVSRPNAARRGLSQKCTSEWPANHHLHAFIMLIRLALPPTQWEPESTDVSHLQALTKERHVRNLHADFPTWLWASNIPQPPPLTSSNMASSSLCSTNFSLKNRCTSLLPPKPASSPFSPPSTRSPASERARDSAT